MAAQAADSAEAIDQAAMAPAPTRRRVPRAALAAGVALIVAAAGAAYILAEPSAESTDDAYVAADTTSVAPRIRGFVTQVLVRDNQTVRAGDPLVTIDPEEFDARLAAARSGVADAQANVAAAQAALVALSAQERASDATVASTATSIRSARADAAHAEADKARYDALVASGAVARRDAETYRTTAVGAEQQAAHASAQLAVAKSQAGVTRAQRPGLEAAVQKAQAALLNARAALALAEQDRRHTQLTAPVDGVIGNRQVRVGDYVQPGTLLLTVVPMQALYVTANFKETQIRRMAPGEAATIAVDALGAKSLRGTVDSLAPGSGSTFSLLPFEPGTGNFTKIVQRVPVRIRLDPNQAGLNVLRPGLSVTAKVRLPS
ncbi:HlyD family secretion protein [Novosphingobium sp.]|uniref:HlyD family secretion protein n=1 Tax=Novosphingobium sp. TaxID=1874826 RepID=UPI003D0B6727